MTSERPRFPIGLTLGAVVVFGVCCGLGAWQLQRGAWKTHELQRIAALKTAPPQPIGPVLAGADASFTRVVADCGPASAQAPYHLTTDNAEWIARARALCRLPAGRFDAVLIDRGVLEASRGGTGVPTTILPPPIHVEGVLYRTTERSADARAAPYILVAERESPPPPGVKPTPYPDSAANLEYVGAYAITWFGLAGTLVAIYAAMLWRRHHPRR
jgi:surfeit locus 1 family protein